MHARDAKLRFLPAAGDFEAQAAFFDPSYQPLRPAASHPGPMLLACGTPWPDSGCANSAREGIECLHWMANHDGMPSAPCLPGRYTGHTTARPRNRCTINSNGGVVLPMKSRHRGLTLIMC